MLGQQKLDLQPDPRLDEIDLNLTNHNTSSLYTQQTPTMADFKQMAMDAYNQRNNQNVSEFKDIFLLL